MPAQRSLEFSLVRCHTTPVSPWVVHTFGEHIQVIDGLIAPTALLLGTGEISPRLPKNYSPDREYITHT